MDNFSNTVGFITGGAAGIGLGVARALGQRGMTVVLADIEADTLDAAAADLRQSGIEVDTAVLDVSDEAAYRAVAADTLERHGAVHFLFNNAGVGGGPSLEDWRWVMDVNVMGVVHGVEFFLPAMLDAGAPGYIINTASLAGHLVNPAMPAYCASKFAVVAYSEALHAQLASSPIDVSVLCPAWVKTRIAQSHRNHPNPSASDTVDPTLDAVHKIIEEEGMSVEDLADRVIRGMASKTFTLFTHGRFWPEVDKRLQRISDDYREVL
jgi:NAD(P)-dependent dehydrogenase (short-subunit alcohol dehydrogenase family)